MSAMYYWASTRAEVHLKVAMQLLAAVRSSGTSINGSYVLNDAVRVADDLITAIEMLYEKKIHDEQVKAMELI